MKRKVITLLICVFVLVGIVFTYLKEVHAAQPSQAVTIEEMHASIIELNARIADLQFTVESLVDLIIIMQQNMQTSLIEQPSPPVINEPEHDTGQNHFSSLVYSSFGNVQHNVNVTMAGRSYNADLTFGTGRRQWSKVFPTR